MSQLLQLKQRLEQKQIQFYNYRMQSKQMYDIIQQQSNKKEAEIRQLKQEAIKRQKQIKLTKNQLSVLQSENTNLKEQIKQLQMRKEASKADPAQSSDLNNQQTANDSKLLALQISDLQKKLEQQKNSNMQQIMLLKKQISSKDAKIKQLEQQISSIKMSKAVNSQPSKEGKKSKIVEITIQKTKQVPSRSFSRQHNQQATNQKLAQDLEKKEGQLFSANQRINKYLQKIVAYQKRIRELESGAHQIQGYQHTQFVQQTRSKSKQGKIKDSNQRGDLDEVHLWQQDLKNQMPKKTVQVLILTKSYYKSPFLQIQAKNVIKLFKTDKTGKVEKSLGSLKYKLNFITHNIEQMLTLILDKTYKNIKNNISSRIILYGNKRTSKKFMLNELALRLKKQIFNKIKHLNQHQHQIEGQNQPIIALYYGQFQIGFKKNVQIVGQNLQEIAQILDNFNRQSEQFYTNPKKHQKQDLGNEGIVRYLNFHIHNFNIQIITSNFRDSQLRESTSQSQALDRLVYSKIPHFDYDLKPQLQIILTINPIVGLYQSCRDTLKIANCKRGAVEKSVNVFDWRQSPNRNALLKNQKAVSKFQPDYQIQMLRIAKAVEKAEYYRLKLNQLLVKLKIMINTNSQISYLKKSQTILNYEKIARFIQAILNQGGSEILSPNKRSIVLQKLHDFDSP